MFFFITYCLFFTYQVTSICDAKKFPDGFKFGAGTASYQVEGAWNASDKAENIFDHILHENASLIKDGSTGDVACDSYHLYKRDVEMAKEMGLQYYRFSISWTRLLPQGDASEISLDGWNYYNNLINELLANGIEPLVTIFHFDLPQRYQEYGGWNNASISDWFAEYADVVFWLFGDRVTRFITINEPIMMCNLITRKGSNWPLDIDPYVCAKNSLLAHAKAYRVYSQKYKSQYGGKLSMARHLPWYVKGNDTEELAELARDYGIGLYSDPILSAEGGWPKNIEAIVAEYNERNGTNGLPAFTDEEKELVKGTFDFFGINYYSTYAVNKAIDNSSISVWPIYGGVEIGAVFETPEGVEVASGFTNIYPAGIRELLAWLKNRYGDMEYLITESGFPSSPDEGLDDDKRANYMKDVLNQILLSIEEDGVNVTGYTVWSLMDNYEWANGYTIRFGLYSVDFNDTARTRTPRKSAQFYNQVIKNREIPETI